MIFFQRCFFFTLPVFFERGEAVEEVFTISLFHAEYLYSNFLALIKVLYTLGSPSNTTLQIFVRKGGGGITPQIRNSFFAGKKIRKGGGVPPLRTKSAK